MSGSMYVGLFTSYTASITRTAVPYVAPRRSIANTLRSPSTRGNATIHYVLPIVDLVLTLVNSRYIHRWFVHFHWTFSFNKIPVAMRFEEFRGTAEKRSTMELRVNRRFSAIVARSWFERFQEGGTGLDKSYARYSLSLSLALFLSFALWVSQ